MTAQVGTSWRVRDDFEELPLKAAAIVDENGTLFWIRYGHDVFLDVEFLTRELRYLNTLSDE